MLCAQTHSRKVGGESDEGGYVCLQTRSDKFRTARKFPGICQSHFKCSCCRGLDKFCRHWRPHK
eukprot:3219295-Amphidinium_carterae.2